MQSALPPPSLDAPAATGTALDPAPVPRPARSSAEQELIFERTWQLAGHVSSLPRPGSYITARAGSQPVLVVRDEDGRAPRLPQRLPPPRLAAAERLGPMQGRDPLPLPRLDLQLRRRADRRTRGARSSASGSTSRRSGCTLRASRRCAAWCSSTSTPTRRPLAELVGDLPARLERYRIGSLEPFGRSRRRRPAGELEGRRRELHRGLPHPDRPSRADADARLQALRRRGPRPLRLVRGAAARQAEQQPPRAPVRVSWSSRCPGSAEADRPVWRYAFIYPNTTIDLYPDQVNTWQTAARRRRADRRRLRLLSAARAAARARGGPVDQPAPQHARAGRGRRPRRERPARSEDARLPVRGPLSRREDAVAWFADRIRADLAPPLSAQ